MRFMLEICSICNAHCMFCPYPDLGRPLQRMPEQIFEQIVARIKEEEINPLSFELHMMGEPFLDPHIFQKAFRLRQEFPATSIVVTTNFNSVKQDTIRELLDSPVDVLLVSLNAATADTYHKIMGLDYDQTVANLNYLLQLRKDKCLQHKKLAVQLSFVACAANEKEKWKFWRQWGGKVDALRFQNASPKASKVFGLPKRCRSKRNYYPCADLFLKLPILSNGDYGLCCQDVKGMINLNVMDSKILDAFHGEVFRQVRAGQLAGHWPKICQQCLLAVDSNGANWFIT